MTSFSNCFLHTVCTWPSRNHVIIVPRWDIPNGNHINDDVVEDWKYQGLSSMRNSLGTMLMLTSQFYRNIPELVEHVQAVDTRRPSLLSCSLEIRL